MSIRLLKVRFDHLTMFENGIFELDLHAEDKVFSSDDSVSILSKPFYTNNIVAIAGINASGKSVALNLLDFALRSISGGPVGGPIYQKTIADLFEGDPAMDLVLWHEETLLLLKTSFKIQTKNSLDAMGSPAIRFDKETLYSLNGIVKKKDDLTGILDHFDPDQATPLAQREKLDPRQSRFLPIDAGFTAAILNSDVPHICISSGEPDITIKEESTHLDTVLRAFDASIEHLSVEDEGRAFRLKQINRQKPVTLSSAGLARVLSSGTLRGLAITQQAIAVLRAGGYLLVDEIENHLNHQLVDMILDLFASRETNPNGATLIFSTHYPEVLNAIHRKDNVYFFSRGGNCRTNIVKFSDRVSRVEANKSEYFVSNYIGGTAPRYADVIALRNYARSEVTHRHA